MLFLMIIIIRLFASDEAETGSAGEQPARNNPIGRNYREVVKISLRFKHDYSGHYAFENSLFLISYLSCLR